jgi:hypothetical protein
LEEDIFIKEGIVYAGTPEEYRDVIDVLEVKAVDNCKPWLHFSDEEDKL